MKGADANVLVPAWRNIVMANDGGVVMDAQDAFKASLARDQNEPRARFYLGLAQAQIGELQQAVAIWRDIEKTAPPDAPWLPMVKENIAAYAKQGGFFLDPASIAPDPATPAPPADAAAILSMNPSDQNAMIHKMVNRLAAKMKDNPNDLDGWERLAKAYSVLGETDKAKDAQNKADALKAKAKSP